MYSVFSLLCGFLSFWFVVAALQTFEPAIPVRPYAIAGAVLFAALALVLFWLGRRPALHGSEEQS